MAGVPRGRNRPKLTHPDRVLFPEAGLTKADLADYYAGVAEWMLPHLRDRPLNLQRFPGGIGEPGFFQQALAESAPAWLGRVRVAKAGGTVTHVVLGSAAGLIYLVNLGTITIHAWLSRRDRLDYPDQMIFDLDPPEDDPPRVREAALRLGALLRELGLPVWAKTTGSRGYHILVPLDRRADYDTVRAFAADVAAVLERRYPADFTTEIRKRQRRDRIFLDTLRNAYGHTAVAPYSVRARPGAPVATPLDWAELEDPAMTPTRFTIGNLLQRLRDRGDPWSGVRRGGRSLARARPRLDRLLAE